MTAFSTPSATTSSARSWPELDHRADDLGRALVGGHGAHEVAVDLQRVEGQAGQVRQRREAGAEVVQRQARAGVAQRAAGSPPRARDRA